MAFELNTDDKQRIAELEEALCTALERIAALENAPPPARQAASGPALADEIAPGALFEAFPRSEQLLSATIASIDGLLNVLAPDMTVLYSNWKDHDYVPTEQRVTQPFCFKAFTLRNAPCPDCPALKTFRDGKIRTIEAQNPATGAFKEVTVTPIFTQQGEVANVVEFVRDVTERRRTMEALEKSEARAQAILAAIPDAMLVVTRQGQVLEWYAAHELLSLADQATPEGQTLGDLFPETIAQKLLLSVCATLDSGAMHIFEYRLPPAPDTDTDGIKEYEARIVKRSPEAALVMVRDVSLLRNAEAALYEANQRLRLAMRFANEGTWECDFAADTYALDEQAARMLGYTPEEARWPAAWWQKRIHPEDRKRVLAAMEASLFKGNAFYSEEYRVQRKDGSYIWISGVGGVVRWDDGKPRLFMGINRDITEKKLAEQKILESEEKYRLLAQNISDAVYTLDEDLKTTYVSPSVERLTGYTREELLTLSPEDCLPPASRQRYLDMIRLRMQREAQGMADPEANYLEFECLRKDGSCVMVEAATSVLRDEVGSFKGFIGVIRDISERKTIERQLRESEERYRSLFENAGDAIYVLDAAKTAFLDANPITWLRLGYTREELLQLHPDDLAPPPSASIHQPPAQLGENHFCLTYECVHLTKQGKRIPVEITAQRISFGGQVAVLYIARDLSERQKNQKALQESEKRFRLIFNTAPVALLEEDYSQVKLALDALREQGVTDFKDYFANHPELLRQLARTVRILAVNPFTSQLFEDDRPGVFPLSLAEVFNEQSFKTFGETLAMAARGDPSIAHMRVHRTRKGRYMDTKYTWTLVPGHEESWDRVLVSVVDVTELIEARRQADLANQAKSQFLSSVSHDIRTPISGIMGMLQLLEHSRLDAQQKAYAATAVQACAQLNRLLADILELSRIEAGKMQLRREPFRIQRVLDSLRDLFSYAMEKAGLAYVIRCDPGLPVLLGDEHGVLRILINLVGNALKFTASGQVSVCVKQSGAPDEHQTIRLLLDVTDTGKGIAAEKIEKLFQPYTQDEYAAPQQGVGLGLSIVKQFVTMMGGSITVSSEIDKGSTFTLELPFTLAPTESSETQPQQRSPAVALPAEFSALVVEDEPISLTTTSRFLEKMGGNVRGAKTGEEALELLQTQSFDVILLDIQLPRMNGLQVVERIRTSPECSSQAAVPIIILTAYALNGDREKFLATGADAYLAKPLEREDLLHTLQQVLGKTAQKRPPS